MTVLPAGSFHGFTVNPYTTTYEIPAGSIKTVELIVPKTVLREWFSGFDGGIVDVTLEDVSGREYTYETIQRQLTMWGEHGYKNSLGLAMNYWNDTYMHGIEGYQTRFNAPNIPNHNEVTVAFKMRSMAGNNIKNVTAFTATYNLIETVGYSQLSKNNDDTYTCYVTFDNLFSPNIKFWIAVEYDEGVGAGPGVSAITTANAEVNFYIPLQDYHDPAVYAEVKSPMDATTGVDNGRTIFKNKPSSPIPSTVAASSISFGSPKKNCLNTRMFHALTMFGKIIDQKLLSRLSSLMTR